MTHLSGKLTNNNDKIIIIAMHIGYENFGDLFTLFRLRSEIISLTDFGKLLADEGFVYEDSIFSKWKQNNRIPKDRKILIAIINIFIKRGGIRVIDEANLLFRSIGMSDLTEREIDKLSNKLMQTIPFTAPNEISNFVTREKLLKEINWDILNKKIVLVHGLAGSGKTTLSIKIAHFLKNNFSDGILWYRFDIQNIETILDNIAQIYGENTTRISDIKLKINYIYKLLVNKNVLLIFDNIEQIEDHTKYFLTHYERTFPILLTSIHTFHQIDGMSKLKIEGFTKEESLILSKKILGIPFVLSNMNKILNLIHMLDYSPLGLNVLLNQIKTAPNRLDTFIRELKKSQLTLRSFQYENKNLTQSLEISYNLLSEDLQLVFCSLSFFDGADFPEYAVRFINALTIEKTHETMIHLNRLSLVETAEHNRYRLHPLVKIFALSKLRNTSYYQKISQYYYEFLTKGGKGNSKYFSKIEKDADNILGNIEKCYQYGFFKEIIKIWEYLAPFLWDSGRWNDIDKYGHIVIKSAKKINDNKSYIKVLVEQLSWMYYWQDNLLKAEYYIEKAIEAAKSENDDILEAMANQKLSLILHKKNLDKKAIILLHNALSVFVNKNRLIESADTLIYLGDISADRQDYKEAINYYHNSLKYGKQLEEYSAESIAYYHMAEVYLKQKKYDIAKDYFDKAFVIDTLRGRTPGIAYGYYAFGKIDKALKKTKNAFNNFSKSITVFKKLGMFQQIALIHQEIKEFQSSVKKGHSSLK